MERQSSHLGRLIGRLATGEQGVALVVVLIVIVGLTALGTATYLLSVVRHGRVVDVKKDVAGVATGDGGIEEARYRLNTAIPGHLTDSSVPPNVNWGLYIKPPSGTAVTSGSAVAEAADPSFQSGYTQVASLQNHANFYWVKIHHKREGDAIPGEYVDGNPGASGQVIYYGYYSSSVTSPVQFTLGALTTTTTKHKPMKVVISYGEEKAGVMAELAYTPGFPIPAALYAEDVVNVNGTSPSVDGRDIELPVGSRSPVPCVVTPGTYDENGNPTMDPDPPGPIQGSPIVVDIAAMVEMLKYDATVLTDDTDDDAPVIQTSTAANPGIYYIKKTTVQGIRYNNVTGYGILMVEGDLALGGGFNWYGVVLVTGNIDMNGGGGGINFHGACLAGGQATLNGGIDFNYNSLWATDTPFNGSPKIIKWREL